MSEKHNKHRSSSRRHKEETLRSSKRRNSYQDYKKSEIEAKTPPLPKNRHSIEDLMRQRESLREELDQLNVKKSTDIKSSRESNKRKHYKDDRRNSKMDHLNSSRKSLKTRTRGHVSPEYNADKYLESEDEESIIEQRRKQRKQLLEKFNITDTITNNENISKKDKGEHKPTEKNHSKDNFTSNKKHMHRENTNSSQLSDMFSEKDDFIPENTPGARDTTDENNSQLTDNWDDAEGYYNIRVGDIINNKYVLKEVLGQGVFANVIHAHDNTNINNASVAIKIVRNNDLMFKTSIKEISVLKEINAADPESKYHCVRYFCNFMHKGHLCIVLEALHMDLRSILKKYGKNHGIHMKALMSYSRQLLMALRLLRKIGIVHADIKPDNILVNEKKNILKLCDFGSAAKLDENEPTPYLVSRFYRAPEIILGIPYNHGIDIWSTACTMYEMATGKILFTGNSNNRMLKCFMDLKGKIPVKLIRRGKFKDQHFNYNNNFLLHKKDEFTGRDKVIEVCNNNTTRDLYKELQRSCKNLSLGEEKKLTQLKDLLEKMLILDPNQRVSVSDCLKHAFIQEELEK